MGKNQNKPIAAAAPARKSRAPRHRGINTPRDVPKAFRSHGKLNSMVVKAAMGR